MRRRQEHSPIASNRRASVSEVFAGAVAGAMRAEGPVLRYSMRLALLRQARGLGLGRFQANLIIATVQHEHRHDHLPPPSRSGCVRCRPRGLRLAVFLAVESLLGLGLWWLAGG